MKANLDSIEKKINSIWREVLQIKLDNNEQNFFSVGGNSIQAMNIISLINTYYQCNLSFIDFLEALTILNLAKCINDKLQSL